MATTTTTASSPPAKLAGGCLCGAVRYEIEGGGQGPIYNVICHCVNCKKATGTHMLNASIFYKSQFNLTSGTPKRFQDAATDSGTPLARFFCGACGGHLYLTTDAVPAIVSVASGSLDEGTSWWAPNKEQYIETKSHWLPDLPVVAKEGVVERHERGPLLTQTF